MKGLTCRQANNEEDALNMLFEVHFLHIPITLLFCPTSFITYYIGTTKQDSS